MMEKKYKDRIAEALNMLEQNGGRVSIYKKNTEFIYNIIGIIINTCSGNAAQPGMF